MLFGTKATVRDSIVEMLLKHGALSYAEIRDLFFEQGKNPAKQAIFAELNNLVSASLVLRRGSKYQLRLAWIYELHTWVQKRLALDVSSPHISTRSRQEFPCKSLADLHRTWSSVGLEPFLKNPGHVYYELAPHFWFPYVDKKSESQVSAQHQDLNIEYRLVLGSDSRRSREAMRMFGDSRAVYVTAKQMPASLIGVNLSIYGPHIFKAVVPIELQAKLDKFFASPELPSVSELEELTQLSAERHDILLTYEINEVRAQALQAVLESELRAGAMGFPQTEGTRSPPLIPAPNDSFARD